MSANAWRALQQAWFTDCAQMRLAPLGDGHIHDTWLISQNELPRYVLQRVNRQVFQQPRLLADNLDRLSSHFAGAPVQIPELVAAADGRHWHVDDDGEWWRLWIYRQRTRTLEAPVSAAEAFAAARVFGRFQRQMQSFGKPRLQPSIPGFLNLQVYLQTFDEVFAETNPEDRGIVDMAFIDAHRDLATRFPGGDEYVHGDCKLDNLLFALDSADVDCVLDLDTVMPGHWAWDFGDLVRSLITLQTKGSNRTFPMRRTGKVRFDPESGVLDPALFVLAVRGFGEGKGARLPLEDLLAAPCYVSFMLGVRFLTDHLAGDVYFRISNPGENLLRAQAQFSIVAALEQQSHQLRAELGILDEVIP